MPDCIRTFLCLAAAVAAGHAVSRACDKLDRAPRNFSHLGTEWSGRCVILYVSLSARPEDGGTVCGTEIFSADSDLVTAAIHAGLFSGYSFAASTVVAFQPGQVAYRGSRRYGVDSGNCGRARLSFTFPADQFPPPPEGPHELSFYSGMLATFSVAAGTGDRVVGGQGSVYSQVSEAGTAAVHAGLLKPGETRILRIWYLPRHPGGFVGSRRNGIAAKSDPEANLAFGYPEARLFWGEAPRDLSEFSGVDGVTVSFRLTCCGPRLFAVVRGSDIFQVGSNFAASALHAGVVRAGEVRTLEVEFLGKQDAFQASYRNGVMSERAGRGDGYRFLSPKV